MSKRSIMIANIAALAAMFVGVINLIIFREIWILGVAMAFLIALTIYSVREKRKLARKPDTS